MKRERKRLYEGKGGVIRKRRGGGYMKRAMYVEDYMKSYTSGIKRKYETIKSFLINC